MHAIKILLLSCLTLLSHIAYATTQPVLHHELRLKTEPNASHIYIKDQLTLHGMDKQKLTLVLNKNFIVKQQGKILQPLQQGHYGKQYQITLDNNQTTLEYQGNIASTPDCDWLRDRCALLSGKGIFLNGDSLWYPQSSNIDLHTFKLDIELPKDWVSLSQGKKTTHGWQESKPQDQLYLIAGKFYTYEQAGKKPGDPTMMVYLQKADPKLAQQYLETSQHYIEEYSQLLGDYPFAKFATVESFWETGWGMPSFTLLGSRVMRLPFILHTSLPHEILHNWWGNGVYVDYQRGNWSEGLTAYLADHRQRKAKGTAADYRRDTLQKFTTFTHQHNDFPLAEFRSRHSRVTEAVGYGKSLMLFHQVRQQLGDDAFFAGLRQFYQQHTFQFATFTDLQQAFEHISGESLNTVFNQWLTRQGAPKLSVKVSNVSRSNDKTNNSQDAKTTLKVQLNQTQQASAFNLRVPITILLSDDTTTKRWLDLSQKQQAITLNFDQAVTALSVDPEFDVFRTPDAAEVPPALNVLFNRQPKTFVMARKLPAGMELPWDDMVDILSFGQDMPVQYDDEALPDSDVVVLLGGDNTMLTDILAQAKQPFKLTEAAYTLNSENYTCGLHSLALTLRAGKQQVILLDASTPQGLESMMRKLSHYGKYSYVLFNSATGENVAKGQWAIKDSPLTVWLNSK